MPPPLILETWNLVCQFILAPDLTWGGLSRPFKNSQFITMMYRHVGNKLAQSQYGIIFAGSFSPKCQQYGRCLNMAFTSIRTVERVGVFTFPLTPWTSCAKHNTVSPCLLCNALAWDTLNDIGELCEQGNGSQSIYESTLALLQCSCCRKLSFKILLHITFSNWSTLVYTCMLW